MTTQQSPILIAFEWVSEIDVARILRTRQSPLIKRSAHQRPSRFTALIHLLFDSRQSLEQMKMAVNLNARTYPDTSFGHERTQLRKSAEQADAAIVSKSNAIRAALAQVSLVAPMNSTVLLLGETGVGKNVFAKAIHDTSPRRHRPMICVNAAAFPATLIESELFGHECGAFTDAVSGQTGRFEMANGSTLFLDEIGELSPSVQVKLLRVLEERTIERLGSSQSIKLDVRIIAATNRSLEHAVCDGRLREDLFYRLNVFPITIAPLRERIEDIPDLAWTFIDELSRTFGKRIESIAPEALSALQRYSWPGNVRELRNVIERAIVVARSSTLTPTVPRARLLASKESTKLVDLQTQHIRSVVEHCGWRIRGPQGAAARLGVKPTTLETRMSKLGICRASVHP